MRRDKKRGKKKSEWEGWVVRWTKLNDSQTLIIYRQLCFLLVSAILSPATHISLSSPLAISCYWNLVAFVLLAGLRIHQKQINIMAAAFAGTQQKCMACDKTVYLVDKLTADNRIYHKACFRCHHCKGTLKAFINFDPLFFISITSILPLMNDLGLLVRFCGYQTCLN